MNQKNYWEKWQNILYPCATWTNEQFQENLLLSHLKEM